MEVSGQLHALVSLPTEREPPVPIVLETEWAPEPVRTLWSREKSLVENWTPAVHPVLRLYADWAIAAPYNAVGFSHLSIGMLLQVTENIGWLADCWNCGHTQHWTPWTKCSCIYICFILVYFLFRLMGLSVAPNLAFKSRLLIFMKLRSDNFRHGDSEKCWENVKNKKLITGSLLEKMGVGEKVTRVSIKFRWVAIEPIRRLLWTPGYILRFHYREVLETNWRSIDCPRETLRHIGLLISIEQSTASLVLHLAILISRGSSPPLN
jgi:hypothetical protein